MSKCSWFKYILNKKGHFGSWIKTIGQWLGPSSMVYNGYICQGKYFGKLLVNIPPYPSWQWWHKNVPDLGTFWIKMTIFDRELRLLAVTRTQFHGIKWKYISRRVFWKRNGQHSSRPFLTMMSKCSWFKYILNKKGHFGSWIKTIGQWLGPSSMVYNGYICQGKYFGKLLVNIPPYPSWQWHKNVPDLGTFRIQITIFDCELRLLGSD